MKKIISIIFFIYLLYDSVAAYTEVSDTWAEIPKVLFGNFNINGLNWGDSPITPIGFDTQTGKYIFKLRLVPGTNWQF